IASLLHLPCTKEALSLRSQSLILHDSVDDSVGAASLASHVKEEHRQQRLPRTIKETRCSNAAGFLCL
ncbi:hypothetical protein, partial [Pseudoalteromonas sp. MTN2-4]|uniref:hypothetical protein n=1 Tax=Pseudoalteromonas sp. MTN2-4 TaxID=3056555 RepID=UPI0036F36CF5